MSPSMFFDKFSYILASFQNIVQVLYRQLGHTADVIDQFLEVHVQRNEDILTIYFLGFQLSCFIVHNPFIKDGIFIIIIIFDKFPILLKQLKDCKICKIFFFKKLFCSVRRRPFSNRCF